MNNSGSHQKSQSLRTLCILLVFGVLGGYLVFVSSKSRREKKGNSGNVPVRETSKPGFSSGDAPEDSGAGFSAGPQNAPGAGGSGGDLYQPGRNSATGPVREKRGRIPKVTPPLESEFSALEVVLEFLRSGAKSAPLQNGWIGEDLQSPVVLSETLSRKSGVTAVHLRQSIGDIEIYNANLNANVAKDGSILSVNNGFVRRADSLVFSREPRIDASSAVKDAARHAMVAFPGEKSLAVVSRKGGPAREVEFGGDDLSQDPIPVKLVYVATSDREIRLAWNLVLHLKDGQRWLDMNVDAENGTLLSQANWYANADYRVFAKPLETPNHGGRTLESDPHDTTSSPFGWHDVDGISGAEYSSTRGNNVDAQEDGDKNNSGGRRPDGGGGLLFDNAINFAGAPDSYEDAAITNLFYWNNVVHDIMWHHGFDELSGNFQANNYGNGGAGGDQVQADAQDGSGTNNANFGTPPDGTPPRMQMFVWTQANPDRDSDLDSGIIVHEYGHGISNRLTGGPANASALTQLQSRGMGEGWSDWFGLVLTASASDNAATGRGIGTYVINQPVTGRGIRPYRYSTDLTVNPLTYGDIAGSSLSAPHGIGTVWCTALWEVYWNLVDVYGWDPDLYTGSGGNNLALELIIEGMKLQPVNPSYLEARDAILLADQVLNGGANLDQLWSAFAKRGMGFSADDGGGSQFREVTGAFDIPDEGISINDVSVVEGASGTTSVTFAVTLNLASDEVITVDWSTQNGSAIASGDYEPVSGQVTFGAGETEETVIVQVAGDGTPEEDETFQVSLSNPAGAYLADQTGVGTILNDDYIPPVINSLLTAGGNIGNEFSYSITAINTPRTFSLSGEPPGMTINPSTGRISWLPDMAGIVNVQVTATNPAGSDTGTLVIDVEENILLTAIDSGSRRVFTGTPPWFAQSLTTHDGIDAAQSGTVTHRNSSWLEVEAEGPEEIVFWWKVSSESNYDKLNFLIDGEIVESISGEVDWTQVFRSLSAGTHSLRWEYVKDGSVDAGMDTGWVDEFSLLVSDQRPFVTSAPSAFGFLGEPFQYQALTSKPADSFSSSALPAGLMLDPMTGLISGTPAVTGSTEVVITATNAAGSTQRIITILVSELAPIPFSDSFESGSLDSYWLATGKGAPRTQVTTGNGPGDGLWHVNMDSGSDGNFSRNELTLSVDVTGHDLLILRFLARSYGDESNSPPPSPFPGTADFDGVAISPDGLNWYEVQALRNELSSIYREFSINLNSAISANGLTPSGIYRIRFCQYDDFGIPLDGIGIDNVRIDTEPVVSAPDLLSSSDLGNSSTDNYTADNTPAFAGTGTPALSLELISDLQGTVATGLIGDNGTWSVTTEELNDGIHEITAVIDGGTVSDSLAVEVNTMRPTVTLEKSTGQGDRVAAGPVDFDVEFSTDVFDFGPEDVAATGDAAGGITVTGGPSRYFIQVATSGKEGLVRVEIPDSVVTDHAGNGNFPATSTGRVVEVDLHGDFADPTPVDVSGGTATETGWIEGADTDAFSIVVTQDCIVRIYTTGTLDTIGSLQNLQGNELNLPYVDDDKGAEQNLQITRELPPGTYVVVVSAKSGGSSYGLFFETYAGGSIQPDLRVEGRGNNIYGTLNGQIVELFSRRGGRVSSSVSLENDGTLPDSFVVSGSNGNSIFRVLYLSEEKGNISGQLNAGTFAVEDVNPGETPYRISVQIIPNKNKVRKSSVRKKRKRVRYKVLRYGTYFRVNSALDPEKTDPAAIRLNAKWK